MQLFHNLSEQCSQEVTKAYSTSFYSAVSMLHPSIQGDIHNIYGFVRFADEIVDTFLDHDREYLLNRFEADLNDALIRGISLNPILHAFQTTVRKYEIDRELIDAFLHSMRMDLRQEGDYTSREDYEKYIYGSADVVGLMCLKVFVNGDQKEYERLRPMAMKLGSAFQKVNFLRDFKSDLEVLNRSYFPNVDFSNLSPRIKDEIITEIENDFETAYEGITQLPETARFGVYMAYKYYRQLLKKLKRTPSEKILDARIRVSDYKKLGLLVQSYFNFKLNLL